MSELAGKSTLVLKAKELGLDLDGPQLAEVVEQLKRLEHEGYHFEVADGSLELLMRRVDRMGARLVRRRVVPRDHRRPSRRRHAHRRDAATVTTEATVKVHVGGERVIATAEGNGPVNALDHALRTALNGRFPALERVHLTDYKVRVLDTNKGTGAVTRVLIDSTDGERPGRRSASTRTSSRRRGRPCSTRSSSALARERRAMAASGDAE